MLREGGPTEAPSVPREHQAALAGVSRTVQALSQGESAETLEAVRERFAQRRALGLGRGLSR
jgi:hypothetical protein